MSDTHIYASASVGNRISGLKRLAVGLAITISIGLSSSIAAFADGELALKNVKVDSNKQLVVEFATGMGAPQSPTISEVPAPTHQLLIDFTGVSLDDKTIPAGDELTRQLAGQLPGVKRASVGVLGTASVPTVRVILDLDPDLVIKPSVAALQDGAAVISFGDAYNASAGSSSDAGGAVTAVAGGAGSSVSASNDPAAAYEEYYRKFLQQKQMSEKQSLADDKWGPRKGTLEEARAIKNGKGVRIIGTPIDSPAVKAVEIAPSPATARRRSAPVAAAPVAESAPAVAAQPAETQSEVAMTPPAASAAPAEAPAPVETPAPAETTATAAPAEMTPVAAPPAATSQISDTAPTPAAKEKEETQTQPDMIGDEPSAAPAPAAPVRTAPATKAVHRIAAVPKAAPSEAEVAVPSGDSTAAPDETMAEGGESPAKRARRLFNQGYQNHIHGKINEAIAMYKEAIKVNSELGDAHSNLGLAYNQQHNYANALSEFYKALAVNPRDAITYNGIGAALRAEQDISGAIKNWETAVQIDPKLAVAHYNLGTAYEAEGQLEKAMVSYEAAVKNDQHLGEAYFRMGIIMQKKHRLQEARAHFKKSLTVAEDSDYAAEARQKIAAIDKLAK